MKPKSIPVPAATGCFYELPDDTNTAQMKQYSRWAKNTTTNYVSTRGRRLFFEFKTARDRDSFLSTLERSLVESGVNVQRVQLEIPKR
ncbi:hypothetical protein [Rudanella lutea]|uniref:hypothetical protein n=1 Tax=Rudanella lutea TaxID=451374 RepID=UPI00035E690C|nr:hypothetical protein [Rudanella lutea]